MEKKKIGSTWSDVFWSLLALALAALVLAFGAKLAHPQTPQGPIATPQLNTDVFVGSVSGFYPSIQNAVTLRCAAAGLGSRVIIPAGSPANGTSGFTIASVTGGCVKVPIIDLRATPPGFYLWVTSAYVLQGTPPAGNAGGDLTGTYPNPAVSKVNGAAVPASSNVLASDANGKLVNATKQGNGTAVQMAAGTTHVANDLAIYDSGGNVIDSTVLISNVPLLNTANTYTADNTFNGSVNMKEAQPATPSINQSPNAFSIIGNYWNGSASAPDTWNIEQIFGNGTNPTSTLTIQHSGSSGAASVSFPTASFGEVDVLSAPTTGWFMTNSALIGKSAGTAFFNLAPTTGVARFGSATGGNFSITPTGSIAGANSSAVQQWSISNANGSALFGPGGAGLALLINAGGAAIAGQNGATPEWQISTSDGSASFKSLGGLTKIVNSIGLQVATGAACGIAAGVGNICGLTLSLLVTEPDTAYSVIGCQFDGNTSGVPVMTASGQKTTTNFVANVANLSASAAVAGGTVTCLVAHN